MLLWDGVFSWASTSPLAKLNSDPVHRFSTLVQLALMHGILSCEHVFFGVGTNL